MNSCGTVSMDRYWSYVGTPLFYTVIGFGVFTLFVTQDVQVASTKDIRDTVKSIREVRDAMENKGRTPIRVTNSASLKRGRSTQIVRGQPGASIQKVRLPPGAAPPQQGPRRPPQGPARPPQGPARPPQGPARPPQGPARPPSGGPPRPNP